MHVFLILTEGDQKSKENEAEKKEKTEKPDPDAEAEDPNSWPRQRNILEPHMQSDTGPQMVWEFIAVFKKHSDTTTDALVLCFPFNSGQET